MYSTNPYMSAELYHECYQMLNLANVGYLLACLLAEEKERKEKKHNPDYSAYTLSQFIQ